jgi:hypothetical protein
LETRLEEAATEEGGRRRRAVGEEERAVAVRRDADRITHHAVLFFPCSVVRQGKNYFLSKNDVNKKFLPLH